MESQIPVLAEALKTTQTAAEENKEEFPHDDVRYKTT